MSGTLADDVIHSSEFSTPLSNRSSASADLELGEVIPVGNIDFGDDSKGQPEFNKLAGVQTRVRERNGTVESDFTGTTVFEPSTPQYGSEFERKLHSKLAGPFNALRRRRRIAQVESFLRGPTPLVSTTDVQPWFPRLEAFFDRLFAPVWSRGYITIPLYLIAWFLAFTFVVRLSYFDSTTSSGAAGFITADSSYWSKNDGCGLDGMACTPFANVTQIFRCPAQSLNVQLLNFLTVGPEQVIFKPLVIGGFDSLSTYRADSWICPSAIQHGLFGNQRGGCGVLTKVGSFTGFVGGTRNGVSSVGFESVFPASYRFDDSSSQSGCQDLQNDILIMNVVLSFMFCLIFRPKPALFFWVLFCVGFWHITMASDSTAFPPNISLGFQYFLPCLLAGYVIYRVSWRYVDFAFKRCSFERAFWYLAGFWVGALRNLTLSWIPVDQLTPSDIAQRPSSLIAVLVIALLVFLVILNQLRVIWRTGKLLTYSKWYGVGVVCIALLFTLPSLEFRFHHYFAALVLLPGTAFVTRPSALFQGFLVGLFLNGIARWGFDAILATTASLVGDGSVGSPLPSFLTNSANFTVNQASIYWNPIPSSIAANWDSFELIIDDVLAYSGMDSNYTISNLTTTIPHYFRLAYSSSGSAGDFTKAATAYINNGTWVDAASGAGG